jgi:hypothetical protein
LLPMVVAIQPESGRVTASVRWLVSFKAWQIFK